MKPLSSPQQPDLEQDRKDHFGPGGPGPLLVKANTLRAVHKLAMADVLQLAHDPQMYRVVALEKLLGGRWKVMLRSLDDAASVMLVRSGTDQVFVVPGGTLRH